MDDAPTSLTAWRGPAAALGLLVFRLHLGVVMVEAGWPKLATTDWFTQQAALLAVGFVAVPTVAGGPSQHLRSDLFIEPGKQFLLGGTQRGAFKVVAKNKGTATVEVKERLRDGSLKGKATLKPGQRGVLRFAEGSTAVLLNLGTVKANLDLVVTGDTSDLRMVTEPVRATGARPAQPRRAGAYRSDAPAS